MSVTVKWGLITGMVYVIFSLISNMLELQEAGGFSMTALLVNSVLFGVTFFTIYMGVKENKDTTGGGYLTFGQGFRSGMGIVLIASLISCVFTFIYLKFIDPGFIDNIMAMTEDNWEKQGMTEEQIETARTFSGYMMNPWAFSLLTIVYVLFWGLIKSLITASILKNEAPPRIPTV